MTQRLPRSAWLFLLVTWTIRMYWAAAAPLANDEAYYWDWSRALQLSYIDHPPAVAWAAAMGRALFGRWGALGARGVLPSAHLVGALFMVQAAALLKRASLSRPQLWGVILATELVPAFSLEGLVLLPDSVLLPALAASLYFSLRAATATRGSAWHWAPAAGMALGLAGLSKYHAAPIAGGLGLGLLLYAWKVRRVGEFCAFLVVAAFIALVVTGPVWLWNATHEWASFRFQGAHGFSGLALDPVAAGRFYLGQMVLMTPLVVIGGILLYVRSSGFDLAMIPLAAALPLLLLLEILAFGKQLLPHWLAPVLWMLVPLLALRPWPRWALRANGGLAVIITGVLPWILAVKPLREGLVASFHGTPGPLSELTLWQPLAQTIVDDPELARLLPAYEASKAEGCPQPAAVASLRWFWAAQLAFHLPGQPQVLSLDQNHRSYYNFRDNWADYGDCLVVILADANHLDEEQLRKLLSTWQQRTITVDSHRDTTVVALVGRFRSRGDLDPVAASMHGYGGDHPAAY